MPKYPFAPELHRRRPATVALVAAMLAAIAVGYVMLAVQPGVLPSFSAILGRWPSSQSRPGWLLVLLVIGVAAAGVSLAMLVLSSFVRNAQSRPYLWLAPLLAGFACLVMLRSGVSLPLAGVPLPWYAAVTGLLMLGGGALLQARAWTLRSAGVLLLGLPLAGMMLSLAAQGGALTWPVLLTRWAALEPAAQRVALTLGFVAVGLALLALSTSSVAARRFTGSDESDDREVTELYDAEHAGSRAWELFATVALTLGAAALVGYLALYRPLLAREARAVASVTQHRLELEQLRERLTSERAAFEQALAAERERGEQALAGALRARTDNALPQPAPEVQNKLAAAAPAASAPEPSATDAEAATASPVDPVRAEASRSAVVTARNAPKSAPAGKPRGTAKPTATPKPAVITKPSRTDQVKRAPRADQPTDADKRRLGGAIDDDPIGGLDDL